MRVRTPLDAGMEQRIAKLKVIGIYRGSRDFFTRINARFALTNRSGNI
jgi:hypothetical protein